MSDDVHSRSLANFIYDSYYGNVPLNMLETLRHSAEQLKKSARSPFVRTVMLCATLLSSAACSPRLQSYLNSASIEVGKIPDDVCVVDGQQKVISVSTQSNGDISLAYIRRDGDVVLKHFSTTVTSLGTAYGGQGQFVFTGTQSNCPAGSR